MPRAGIREVAGLAGVAIGTVSNYLNHPDRVSDEKAQRIQRAIDVLGFVPSNAGRQLRLGVSSMIGYIAPELSNPHFAEIAESVERRADERGVSVFFANSHRDRDREDAYLRVFEQHQAQGLLIASHHPIEDRLQRLESRGIPTVLVGQRASRAEQICVTTDDIAGGRRAAEHLLELGCRRIAFVGGSVGIPQVADRLAGASEAVRAFGAATMEFIGTPELGIGSGREAGRFLADRPEPLLPDGVFAANDLLALGVLHEAVAAGIEVPRRLAVIGYDDNEFADASLIPLTSVRGRHDGFGVAVVDLLFDAIAREPIDRPHRLFDPELVVRESTRGFGAA